MNTGIFIGQILEKIPGLTKNRAGFMLHLLILWLGHRGRYNFEGLSRWGRFGRGCYRGHFLMPFDWLLFNAALAGSHMGGRRAIVLDPSHLPKSGGSTAGVGRFYSGCAGRALRGLEILGMAVVPDSYRDWKRASPCTWKPCRPF